MHCKSLWIKASAKCINVNVKQTSEDYNGQSGLLRELSVPLCPAFKIFTPPERGKGAKKVTLDPSHPVHSLFELLPSGQRYRSPKQPDTRAFFPQAISHLNNT